MMPYKDKEAKLKASRESMRKKREFAEGLTSGVNKEGLTDEGLTQYPAILRALVDPAKRAKLENVYHSLSDFRQAEHIYYGCGKNSIPFDVVGDLLETTK